jgi:drug/metabolite transporter (DMT)-like permease
MNTLHPISILLVSQAIFTATDLLGRYGMRGSGAFVEKIAKPWFVLFLFGHIIASIGQLFVFSKFDVGKTVTLFGAVSIVTAGLLGFLLLKEAISLRVYFGMAFAVIAFCILALEKS